MQEILPLLQSLLQTRQSVCFEVLSPDVEEGLYAGETVVWEGEQYLYRSLRNWMELAQLLGCRMNLPQAVDEGVIRLCFKKLSSDSFHRQGGRRKQEKYGSNSLFARIHKMEEAAFLYYYKQALENVHIADRKRILDLGVNRADEFEVIRNMIDIEKYKTMELVGVDHSESALAHARTLFPENHVQFIQHDINDLGTLGLGRFDLLISIGTLQSPGIDFKPLMMSLVQEHLSEDAAVILGFPNARWVDGEMLYGAKVPHYAMSEMGTLLSDVMFVKKYLQQKRYRVTVTGKQYLFLTATKIGTAKEKRMK